MKCFQVIFRQQAQSIRSLLLLTLSILLLMCSSGDVSAQELLTVEKKTRVLGSIGKFEEVIEIENWEPEQTAFIIIDMWDAHWCPNLTERVAELAPFMNEVVKSARNKGVHIIHAPSDVTEFYSGHPARIRAQNTSRPVEIPEGINDWCAVGPLTKHEDYPIDQSGGGCECDACPEYNAWSRQVPSIEIFDEDMISDSGVEIWSILEDRKIKNVLVAGVAANMCILGRPFGLRNLLANGKNVVFVRDLTDTMYDPESSPYVDHFTGTDLVVAFIEKYVGPTTTSTFLTGKRPFRFAEDKREK